MNVWTKLRRVLEEAATMLSNAHTVAQHELLRAVVDGESNREQHKANHEQRPVVNTPANHLAHFLRYDSRHGMDRLKESAQPLSEIGNGNPVSGAEQHH